jgi:hypothetical protein
LAALISAQENNLLNQNLQTMECEMLAILTEEETMQVASMSRTVPTFRKDFNLQLEITKYI